MSKQTSVEWLAEADNKLTISFLEGKMNKFEFALEKGKILEQAKWMHIEEIRVSYMEGAFAKTRQFENQTFKMPTEYYNETYGKEVTNE